MSGFISVCVYWSRVEAQPHDQALPYNSGWPIELLWRQPVPYDCAWCRKLIQPVSFSNSRIASGTQWNWISWHSLPLGAVLSKNGGFTAIVPHHTVPCKQPFVGQHFGWLHGPKCLESSIGTDADGIQGTVFIYCWLIAQSTAQGHLRAFDKFKFCTQVEYNTKHAHYINVKHANIRETWWLNW